MLAHQRGCMIRTFRSEGLDDLSMVLDLSLGGKAALKRWHQVVEASDLVEQAGYDPQGSRVAPQFGKRQMKGRRGDQCIIQLIASMLVKLKVLPQSIQVRRPRSACCFRHQTGLDQLSEHEDFAHVLQAQGTDQVAFARHDNDPILLDQKAQRFPYRRFRDVVVLDERVF
jgi:hypothetical protein